MILHKNNHLDIDQTIALVRLVGNTIYMITVPDLVQYDIHYLPTIIFDYYNDYFGSD